MTRVGDFKPLSVTKVTQVATMVFETIEQRYLWSGGRGAGGSMTRCLWSVTRRDEQEGISDTSHPTSTPPSVTTRVTTSR